MYIVRCHDDISRTCPRILKLKNNINKLWELINRHKEGLLPPANYFPSVAIKKKIITETRD
jgi:hypothetical protein